MDFSATFVGILHLPDKELLAASSPVLLQGDRIAEIRWHFASDRFEVLDADGSVVAECQPQGMFRQRYTVVEPNGRTVIDVIPGTWSTFDRAELVLSSGRPLTIRRMPMWSDQEFEFYSSDLLIGNIARADEGSIFRPDSYEFQLFLPALSALEAISLAQVLRVIVRNRRQAG